MNAEDLTPAEPVGLRRKLGAWLQGITDRGDDRLLTTLDELQCATPLAILTAADLKPAHEAWQA